MAWMVFEVLSSTEESASKALSKHFEKLKEEAGTAILSHNLETPQKVERPLPGLEIGYSQVLETEVRIASFPRLVELVIAYGPSIIEIQSPNTLKLSMGEIQEALT